jgi:hypothetical protein
MKSFLPGRTGLWISSKRFSYQCCWERQKDKRAAQGSSVTFQVHMKHVTFSGGERAGEGMTERSV